MIKDYLEKLGFNNKEKELYLTLTEIGVQPASVIAQKCGFDRVTTYKNLKKMADKGFVKTYYQNNIQCFGIETFENLKIHLNEKFNKYSELLEEFPMAEKILTSMKEREDLIPRLQIFQGEAGIKNFFRNLLEEAEKENVHQIRMLTSNTFEERLGDIPLSKFVKEFFTEIKKRKIDLEIFEATGTLIPEALHKTSFKDFDPNLLPAAKGTTSIFLAGYAVYIACYKSSQIGLKIKHSEMSQIFHFMFDILGKKK